MRRELLLEDSCMHFAFLGKQLYLLIHCELALSLKLYKKKDGGRTSELLLNISSGEASL